MKMLTGILTEKPKEALVEQLARALKEADTVVVGAGAGMSTSAGFTYDGERFQRYFADFGRTYGFRDMYTGGFWPYETFEEHWAYWSRYIYVNRYMDPPKPVYEELRNLVKDKDYFVITTNVDHCFQKAGFDKERLFYTQGDYGLFQCRGPCHQETYDNEGRVRAMLEAQGFKFGEEGERITKGPGCGEDMDRIGAGRRRDFGGNGQLFPPSRPLHAAADPSFCTPKMRIPSDLVPRCPKCGKPMTMNLRSDDTFVEDEGWHLAAERYQNFLRTRTGGKILYLELGVGYNTPVIIKYPFWRLTAQNPDAIYVCLNKGNAGCPPEIRKRSICIDADIGEIVSEVNRM